MTTALAPRSLLMSAALCALLPAAAFAQDAAVPPASTPEQFFGNGQAAQPAARQPSPDAMENLIRLLVENRVLTADQGVALLTQARAEAQAAQATAQIARQGTALAAAPEGAARVQYVPQVVREQITEEVREEILAQAEFQGWAKPGEVPKWVKGVQIKGDVRFRSQSNLLDNSNGEFIDFQAFNEDGPTETNALTNDLNIPLLNTTRDRTNRLSVRARLGIEAKVAEGVRAGIWLASGNDDGPVSTTAALGGGFDKKDIWLDQAYIALRPWKPVELTLGRFDNPFDTSSMLFDEDVNFDGVAVQYASSDEFIDGVKVSATAGAFPYDYVSNDFPSASSAKGESRDKYIYGGEMRAEVKASDSIRATGAVAYFDFVDVQSELSDPCALFTGNTQCSSDQTVPDFVGQGNTLFFTRNIVDDPSLPPGTTPQPQFAGLLYDYNILSVRGGVAADFTDRLTMTLNGTYIRNLAYEGDDFCAGGPQPVNNIEGVNGNFDPCTPDTDGNVAIFGGRGYAWEAVAGIGSPLLARKHDWRVEFLYRYVGSDAVVAGLTDSDFHLGGTNAKGYIVSAWYYPADRLQLRARWYSSNEISFQPLSIDVLQLDLVAKF